MLVSPAILLTAIIGIYTIARVPEGSRSRSFAMLAFTSLGVVELVNAAMLRARRAPLDSLFRAHVLTGIGSLFLGAASLIDNGVLIQAIGAVFFLAGMFMYTRHAADARSSVSSGADPTDGR